MGQKKLFVKCLMYCWLWGWHQALNFQCLLLLENCCEERGNGGGGVGVCECVCGCVWGCKKHKSMYRLQFKCLDSFRAKGRVVLECSSKAIASSGHGSGPLKCSGKRAASLG